MYTKEMTEHMIATYTSALDKGAAIAELAKEFDKSERSIISKLSREKVYQKQQYLTKTGEKPILKSAIARNIAGMLQVELPGLEKAPKVVLKVLKQELMGWFGITEYGETVAAAAAAAEGAAGGQNPPSAETGQGAVTVETGQGAVTVETGQGAETKETGQGAETKETVKLTEDLKPEIVADIANVLEIEPENLIGLEKVQKLTLEKLRIAVNAWFGDL